MQLRNLAERFARLDDMGVGCVGGGRRLRQRLLCKLWHQCNAKHEQRKAYGSAHNLNQGAVKGVLRFHTGVPMWTLRAEGMDQWQVRV